MGILKIISKRKGDLSNESFFQHGQQILRVHGTRSRPASSEFSVHPLLHSGCHRSASITALYYVTLKMARDEESYIARSFFRSFKQKLQTGDHHQYHHAPHRCCSVYRSSDRQSRKRSYVQRTFQPVHCICTDLCDDPSVHLSDPSKFFNSVKNTFVNAFLMSVRHLPLTLLMLVISASPLLLMWLFAYVLRTVYIHPDHAFYSDGIFHAGPT